MGLDPGIVVLPAMRRTSFFRNRARNNVGSRPMLFQVMQGVAPPWMVKINPPGRSPLRCAGLAPKRK